MPKIPGWIRCEGSEFRLDSAKAAIVRRMVGMALGGLGALAIARMFNEEKVPPLSGRCGQWDRGTIRFILRSRALIGHGGVYPPVVPYPVFAALQDALAVHQSHVGGRGAGAVVNLFGDLLWRPDGTQITIKKNSNGVRYLQTSPAFLYEPFERAFRREVCLPPMPKPSYVGKILNDFSERPDKIKLRLRRGRDFELSKITEVASWLDRIRSEESDSAPRVASSTETAERAALRYHVLSVVKGITVTVATWNRIGRAAIGEVAFLNGGYWYFWVARWDGGGCEIPANYHIGLVEGENDEARRYRYSWSLSPRNAGGETPSWHRGSLRNELMGRRRQFQFSPAFLRDVAKLLSGGYKQITYPRGCWNINIVSHMWEWGGF